MFRHAFTLEVKSAPTQVIEIRGQQFKLHMDFWNEVPGRIEVTDLDDRRPRELTVGIPDVFVVELPDGSEVKLYRSWWGSHMGRVQSDPYKAPNGNPMVTYYKATLALRGDDSLDDPKPAQGFATASEALAYMDRIVPGYPAPPWMFEPLLFVQYRPGDAIAYTPAEWHASTKQTDYRTALIWAVSMREARAIFGTFNRTCLDSVDGQIDWNLVSDQVQAIN